MTNKVKKEKLSNKLQTKLGNVLEKNAYSEKEIQRIFGLLSEEDLLAGDGIRTEGWIFEDTLTTARHPKLGYDTLNKDGRKISKMEELGRKTPAYEMMRKEWDKLTIPIYKNLQKKYMVRK